MLVSILFLIYVGAPIFPQSDRLVIEIDEIQDRSNVPIAADTFCQANCTTSLVERSRFGAIIIPFLLAFQPPSIPPLFTFSCSFSLPLSYFYLSLFISSSFSFFLFLSTVIFRSLF